MAPGSPTSDFRPPLGLTAPSWPTSPGILDELDRDTPLATANEYLLTGMLANRGILPQVVLRPGSPGATNDVTLGGASPAERMGRVLARGEAGGLAPLVHGVDPTAAVAMMRVGMVSSWTFTPVSPPGKKVTLMTPPSGRSS